MNKRLLNIANAIILQNKHRAVDPTEQFLIDNARVFWKFNGIGEITTQSDLTGNGWDLTPTQSPFDFSGVEYYDYRFADYSRKGVYRAELNGLFLPQPHNTLLRQSHEFHIVVAGYLFNDIYLAGVANSTTVYALYIDTSGRLVLRCRFSSSGESIVRTVNGIVYGTGSQGRRFYAPMHIRTQVDFENDTFRVWVNGGEFATELVSGVAISSWNPTYYVGGFPFAIGSYNSGNSVVGQATYYRDVFYCAVTDILNNSDAWDVTKYFMK
jgi:hypothetical protein